MISIMRLLRFTVKVRRLTKTMSKIMIMSILAIYAWDFIASVAAGRSITIDQLSIMSLLLFAVYIVDVVERLSQKGV